MTTKPIFVEAELEIHDALENIKDQTGVTKKEFVNWAVRYCLFKWDIKEIEKIRRRYILDGDSIFNTPNPTRSSSRRAS